jgi:hypothetical protein
MIIDNQYCCFNCGTPMSQPTESRCCSAFCEQQVETVERASMDELMDDRLAEIKFLQPINPDPVTAMAKELKKGS